MTEEKAWYEGVPAPVDKNGAVVPLDTKELVNEGGEKVKVCFIGYRHEINVWFVQFDSSLISVSLKSCAMPDTLEKLADDLERYEESGSSCAYFGMEENHTCSGCPGKEAYSCWHGIFDDVLHRINALRERDAKGDER